MGIRTTHNTTHYKWGDNCDGWHLLKTDSLNVIQEKMPAGTREALHYHAKSQQFFYILKGIAVFELDGQQFEVHANQGFCVECNQKHRILNDTESDLEFIVVSEPPSHGDRINL